MSKRSGIALSLVLALAVAGCAADGGGGDVAADTPRADTRPVDTAIATMTPHHTRDGRLRFVDRAVRSPAAAAPLIERLAAGDEPREVRLALAEAIARTRGDYTGDVLDVLRVETDPEIRALLVAALGRAARLGDDAAQRGLVAAAADPDPAVRVEVVHAAASLAPRPELAIAVIAAIDDPEPAVRAGAARSAGVLQLPEAVAALVARMDDPDQDVRREVARSLHRIDGR